MYREPPDSPPLVVTSDKLVQAFDSATGRPLWEVELEGLGIPRLASTGSWLLAAVGKHVKVIDLLQGRVLFATTLSFDVATAVAHGGRLVVAGNRGVAAFDERGYAWGVRSVEGEPGFLGMRGQSFVVEDGQGREMAKLPRFAGEGVTRADFGLCLGPSVAQPDRG